MRDAFLLFCRGRVGAARLVRVWDWGCGDGSCRGMLRRRNGRVLVGGGRSSSCRGGLGLG